MAVGPIPWTARVRYAEVNQFDADLCERFFAGIKSMDEVFVEEVNKGGD